MKPTRIFLDLDDVLNAFTMSALGYVGCGVGAYEYDAYNPQYGFDIVRAANALHPFLNFTEADFWQSIDRNFWATVPKSRECDSLLSACENLVGVENVCILSSPTRDPDSLAGKLEWIHAFLPKRFHRQFLIGPRKYFCARHDSLLIDDSARNVDGFLDAGGNAILMPRPWNRHHSITNSLRYVMVELSFVFQKDFCYTTARS